MKIHHESLFELMNKLLLAMAVIIPTLPPSIRSLLQLSPTGHGHFGLGLSQTCTAQLPVSRLPALPNSRTLLFAILACPGSLFRQATQVHTAVACRLMHGIGECERAEKNEKMTRGCVQPDKRLLSRTSVILLY